MQLKKQKKKIQILKRNIVLDFILMMGFVIQKVLN